MKKYLDAVRDVLETGQWVGNRTGIDTLFKHGLYMTFDMKDGFPLITTKEVNWKSCFAEMLGFWRGYNNAAAFRSLGTKVWDANANQNKDWLSNINRKFPDDLGPIYGHQGRFWRAPDGKTVDQLEKAYMDLSVGEDDRREIVMYWNPGELDKMALPPCHLMYQFGLRGETLDLFVYIRSNDMGLGMPFNIAGYAWKLHMMAKIANKQPGTLHYFAWNYHIYANHIEQLTLQLEREPRPLPTIVVNPDAGTLHHVDNWEDPATLAWIADYDPHPSIKMEMAV